MIARLLLGSMVLLGSSQAQSATQCASPAKSGWAQPVVAPVNGLPNLHRVANNIYRSAQPTEEGFRDLDARLKVKAVISLRHYNRDEPLAVGGGLKLMRFSLDARNAHNQRGEVVKALRALWLESRRGAVLIHCWHGADRTGLIVALYRIVFENWCKEAAIEEMLRGGFGFHEHWWRNIPQAIRVVDIDNLRLDVLRGN